MLKAVIAATLLVLAVNGGSAMAAPAPVRHVLVERPSAAGPVKLDVTVRGSGPVVVLVASLGRGASDFDDLAERLAAAGYEAAAIDPRGIGASTGPMDGLTMNDFADDVAAVAAKLSDRPVALVGHAFGNRVARATAARRPEAVARLILLAAGGQSPPAPDIGKALMDVFDERLSPEAHLENVRKAFFAPGNDPAVWRGGWNTPAMRMQLAALRATGPETWTGAGSAPVLIIQATDDLIAPPANAEILARTYPDRVRVALLAHAGHAMLPEQPAEIARLVIAELKTAR